MARTDTLGHFLTDVADAIREKGGTSELIQASDFDTAIENLPSGGGADLSEYFVTEIAENTSSEHRYSQGLIKKMPNIIVSSNVTSLSYAFSYYYTAEGTTQAYSSLVFPLPKVIFGNNVTDLSSMYRYCNATKIDLTNCDTSNVINMSYMFNNCDAIEIDMRGCESSNVTTISRMFMACTNLQKLDIRDMTFGSVTTNQYVFGSNSSNYVPVDCLIIVKTETEKNYILGLRSDFTNVKTVAEYEAEQSK